MLLHLYTILATAHCDVIWENNHTPGEEQVHFSLSFMLLLTKLRFASASQHKFNSENSLRHESHSFMFPCPAPPASQLFRCSHIHDNGQ
jgi:hypothetical protein